MWFGAPALAVLALLAAWRGARRLALVVSLLGVLCAGLYLQSKLQPGPPPQLDAASREVVTLGGCVVVPPVLYEGRDQFVLELEAGARATVNLYVKDGEQPPALAYGQRIEIDGTVRRTRNFQNPGAFDYAHYLARQSIYWTVSAKAGSAPRVLPGACGSRFWSAIYKLRMAGLEQIERLYAGNAYAIGMLQGILLGDTTKLEKIWTEHYRRTGTYHALVISGLHITVIAGVLLLLLRVLFVPEIPALALTGVVAWVYALVSGWSAPVVRAAGGFTLYLVVRYFYRRGRVLNLLAAVAIAFLACDPEQLFDASFQLSFLSVAAIGALAAPLIERTTGPLGPGLRGLLNKDRGLRLEPRTAQFRVEVHQVVETVSLWTRVPMRWAAGTIVTLLRLAMWVWECVTISTVVQVGLALPMAIYFHRISFSGLTANVLVVPLLSAVVPIGFFAIFSGWRWVARCAGLLLDWSQAVADFHARWEPNWRVPDPPLWLALGFTAALLFLAMVVRAARPWRWAASAAMFGLFGLVLWHPFEPRVVHGSLEFTTIDVGQGDSLLLVFPNGQTMLVDAGGIPVFGKRRKPRMDIGEDVVAPYLWSRSLRRIDMVAATHLHADHAGGLPAIIEDFRPAELWISAPEDSALWRAIAEKAKAVGTRIIEMRAGGGGDYGGAHVDVLSPAADAVPGTESRNNDSLVLRVSYGRHTFLLMGDADRNVEANTPLPRAEVLKVAHHGSKTSTSAEMLQAVRPPWAVISVGADNLYRNPHQETLERLAGVGTAVFRTDEDGLVTIRTDGQRIATETWRSLTAR